MTRTIRRGLLIAFAAAPLHAQSSLPTQLGDSAFRAMIASFSEPAGYFDSDNLLSNEASYQWVIPRLVARTGTGGVYLGVGPEQNFTYIAAMKPRMAFIFDIRRGNLLMHLMYKAAFELSPTRADFVARLMSRARPAGLDTLSSAQTIFTAIAASPADTALFRRNVTAALDHLTGKRGLTLTPDDRKGIEYIMRAFAEAGPSLDYNYPGPPRAGGFRGRPRPTYASLMAETDSVGVPRGYLATEANWRVVRDLQMRNLIVPLVGNFAGPHAVRAVGQYLRDRGAVVSAFYTSNVEQYLFQQGDDAHRFYGNVATLPVDSTGVFIRSVFNGRGAAMQGNGTSASLLSGIAEVIDAFRGGRIAWYDDVIRISR